MSRRLNKAGFNDRQVESWTQLAGDPGAGLRFHDDLQRIVVFPGLSATSCSGLYSVCLTSRASHSDRASDASGLFVLACLCSGAAGKGAPHPTRPPRQELWGQQRFYPEPTSAASRLFCPFVLVNTSRYDSVRRWRLKMRTDELRDLITPPFISTGFCRPAEKASFPDSAQFRFTQDVKIPPSHVLSFTCEWGERRICRLTAHTGGWQTLAAHSPIIQRLLLSSRRGLDPHYNKKCF